MKPLQLKKLVINTLDENKAEHITCLNVQKLTDITDYMVVCSATSARHIKALASHLIDKLKENGVRPHGVQGADNDCDWLLVDCGDILVHIMLQSAREFYEIEKLWEKITYSIYEEEEGEPANKEKKKLTNKKTTTKKIASKEKTTVKTKPKNKTAIKTKKPAPPKSTDNKKSIKKTKITVKKATPAKAKKKSAAKKA